MTKVEPTDEVIALSRTGSPAGVSCACWPQKRVHSDFVLTSNQLDYPFAVHRAAHTPRYRTEQQRDRSHPRNRH